MATSQNGFAALMTNRTTGSLPRLRKWIIPGTDRHAYLRDGSAGFLLAHVAHWFNENIERLGTGTWDDWGWAVRPVRGQTSGYSNHASGTAIDLNATQHPRGRSTRATFSQAEIDKIHAQLKTYEGVIRWGGDYTGTPDGMHFEINQNLAATERVARKLWDSKHGAPVLAANPGAASVIWDGQVPSVKAPAKVEPAAPKPALKPAAPKPATGERLAVDYSYAKGKMSPAAIKAAGFRGVARYLSGNAKKDITADEARRILDAGLWLFLVWELAAKRAAEGHGAGVADALAANKQADDVGYPRDAALAYAVDWDAAPATVAAYFDGVNATPGRPVAIYGSKRIIDAGLAKYGWQTEGWSKDPKTGKRLHSAKADLIQLVTRSRSIAGAAQSDWDENLVVPGRVIPVWNPGEKAFTRRAATPKPTPAPVPAHPASGSSHTHLHLNVQRTMSHEHVTADLDKALGLGADVVGLCEMETDWHHTEVRRLAKVHGYAVYTGAGAQKALVICVRNGYGTVSYVRYLLMSKGVKLLQPNRYDFHLRVTRKDKQTVTSHVIHQTSSAWTGSKDRDPERQALWTSGWAKAVPAILRTVRFATLVVATGDLNVTPAKFRELVVPSVLGLRPGVQSADYVRTDHTHGGTTFDYALFWSRNKFVTVASESTPEFNSDHDGVLTRLEW